MEDEKEKPTGRQKGGYARKEALSEQERKAIAERAAAVRWKKPQIASHKGNFKGEFGADVECYVLDDAIHTPVISQRGMGKALGLSERGSSLPRFLATNAIRESVGAEVIEKFKNPIKFQWGSGGAEQPPAEVNGYDATLLVDLCRAIIDAYQQQKLPERYSKLAHQASIIISASAKSGIRGLVYALAGYSPTAEEVIHAFKLYVQEEARKYEKEFPNELYEQWYRLYQIPPMSNGKPWQFKYLTINHIYYPLAKSNGKILELMRALKASHGDRKKKLFQFLNEVGARALRIQIGRVLEMSESSDQKSEYETKIFKRFGGQGELELVVPPPAPTETPS